MLVGPMWNEVQTAYFDKLRLRQIYLQKEAIAFSAIPGKQPDEPGLNRVWRRSNVGYWNGA
jgi:hypothetical protein